MKKDKYKTIVVFLKDTSEDFRGSICALFPFEYYSHKKDNIRCGYAHIGQHTAVSLEYAKECKIAHLNEFRDLYNELESLGYNLKVVTKVHYGNELPWNGLKNEAEYHRKPTPGEIKFGHGATHYMTFGVDKFLKEDGTVKSRIKGEDGLIYTNR